MTLFCVDSMSHLARLAPNLHSLNCLLLNITPATAKVIAPVAAAAEDGASSSHAQLPRCRCLAASILHSTSAKAAVAGLAAAFPALAVLLYVPLYVPTDGSRECDDITLQDLQEVFPRVSLAASPCTTATSSGSSLHSYQLERGRRLERAGWSFSCVHCAEACNGTPARASCSSQPLWEQC
jgi:hypothetical protein